MIRVCTELEKRMKGKVKMIEMPAYEGDTPVFFNHPARSILDGGWHRCYITIDRIVGDMVVNGRTYCLPSRYYLGGKMLMPVMWGRGEGVCVWFGREDWEKLLLEMGELAPGPYEHQMNDAKKKIYDYLVEKE